MKSNLIKGKKHVGGRIAAILLCLVLCGCTNMSGYDMQGAGVTADAEGGNGKDGGDVNGDKESGKEGDLNFVPLFDDETIFQDIDNGAELVKILNETMARGQIYPVKADEVKGFGIEARTKKGKIMIRKVDIDGHSAIRIGNTYYAYDERVEQFAPKEGQSDDVINRLLSQSIQCDEPVDDMDYIALAEKLVYSFLDTLKTETGKYALKKYTPDYATLEAKGYVGNGVEFCVAVYFKTDIEDDASAFYSENGYDTFYHYYYGPMVYVRCHYENGHCEVVEYDDAFQADLTSDLNGTSAGSGTYPTFWEFYDDTENLEKLMQEATDPNAAEAVAGSPIMLADGQIGYVFIVPRNGIMWQEKGKTYGVFDNYFSTAQEATYSSPIDYKDGSGACTEQYETFDLIWDDYNGDGNPEYAIKQDAKDEDENGARYEVRCMSNDMTPRDTRFDFYMAGRHEECIHLQMTERGVVIWKLEDGVMTPNRDVDDLRMYSRRYYLPGNMRGYTDEQEIQCFFWNNTGKEVSTGSSYHIEYHDGSEWVKVSEERSIKSVKCPAYRDVTLTFDISGIPRENGEYRIVLGKEQVCGGFYIRGERISARVLQSDSYLTIINDGTASLRIYDVNWVKDGKVVGPIDNNSGRVYGVVPAGQTKSIVLYPTSTFNGMYSVRVDVGTILESEPVEYKYVRYFGDAQATERDGTLVLTVDVKADVTGDASVEWFTENDWEATQFEIRGLELKAGKQEIVFGEDISWDMNSAEFEDYFASLQEELAKMEESGRLAELTKDELEEYKRIVEMDKEELYYYIIGAIPMEKLMVAPLRIQIANEYIYVNVK
ncbi:MAG: hypothetical protein J5546_00890 [Lachnospiraceae bacterium]|nr:hypothetical protein [Lachnospiraceae bacterium]